MEPAESEPFCIFKELFRKYDAESKLLLLEEILLVGGAKELWFLESLVSDEDPRVRKRAAILARELSAKLRDESASPFGEDISEGSEPEVNISGDSQEMSLFNLEFALLEPADGPKEALNETRVSPIEPIEDKNQSPLMEKLLAKLKQDQH
jgi:hypothetical protein